MQHTVTADGAVTVKWAVKEHHEFEHTFTVAELVEADLNVDDLVGDEKFDGFLAEQEVEKAEGYGWTEREVESVYRSYGS